MLAYNDDIVILGDTKNYVIKATKKLIEFRLRMNLTIINEKKTKYPIMTLRSVNKTALKVGPPLNKWMNLNTLEST